jgi:hypothetical protein
MAAAVLEAGKGPGGDRDLAVDGAGVDDHRATDVELLPMATAPGAAEIKPEFRSVPNVPVICTAVPPAPVAPIAPLLVTTP